MAAELHGNPPEQLPEWPGRMFPKPEGVPSFTACIISLLSSSGSGQTSNPSILYTWPHSIAPFTAPLTTLAPERVPGAWSVSDRMSGHTPLHAGTCHPVLDLVDQIRPPSHISACQSKAAAWIFIREPAITSTPCICWFIYVEKLTITVIGHGDYIRVHLFY